MGCGLAAGLLVTAVLNPWDRALYLSIANGRPFFHKDNWRRPYQGMFQTLFQRACSSGLYFPLEDYFTRVLGSSLLGGQAAGISSGVLLNPLALVKYHSWGSEESRSFLWQARRLLNAAGPLVFLRGALTTAARDAVFGSVFSLRRCELFSAERSSLPQSVVAMGCSALAAAASSPFNYVRNMAYREPPSAPLESRGEKVAFLRRVSRELAKEVAQQASAAQKFTLLWRRMGIGWGTLRVACGMALTAQTYNQCLGFTAAV